MSIDIPPFIYPVVPAAVRAREEAGPPLPQMTAQRRAQLEDARWRGLEDEIERMSK